jgi:hypothetical protein
LPFIPAANTAQVKLIQRLHSQTVENVFYVENETGWSTAELTALCELFITWWNANYAANISIDMTLQAVQARDMSVAEGAGVEVGAPPLSGGDLNNPALPGNVCLAVKHKSGLVGRSRNGRTFSSGIPEDKVNGNVVTDLYRDNLVISFGQLRDALLAAGYTHVVASFYHGTVLAPGPGGTTRRVPVPRPGGALLTPVEQYVADVAIDSQKRRLQGRGI